MSEPARVVEGSTGFGDDIERRAALAVMDYEAIRDHVPYDPDAPKGDQVPHGEAFPADARTTALELLSYLGLYPGSEVLRTTAKETEPATRAPCNHHHDDQGVIE